MESKTGLKTLLDHRGFSVDPTVYNIMNDQNVIRLWDANGDLIYYNEAFKKVTSYSPLDLCYYNLKTLWAFERDGYERFKSLAAQAMLGQSLHSDRTYRKQELLSPKKHVVESKVRWIVPVLDKDKIAGLLFSGAVSLIR